VIGLFEKVPGVGLLAISATPGDREPVTLSRGTTHTGEEEFANLLSVNSRGPQSNRTARRM